MPELELALPVEPLKAEEAWEALALGDTVALADGVFEPEGLAEPDAALVVAEPVALAGAPDGEKLLQEICIFCKATPSP